jgi:hypothetical protein
MSDPADDANHPIAGWPTPRHAMIETDHALVEGGGLRASIIHGGSSMFVLRPTPDHP